MAKKKVIVTGSAGFIGFHVSKFSLASDRMDVVGIDNMNDYYDTNLKIDRNKILESNPSFNFYLTDLSDHAAVDQIFSETRPQAVVHLAAQAGVRYSLQSPRSYISSNLDGFLAILEACRKYPVEHLVYASSSSVYGRNRKVPFGENDIADHPVSLYAATKRANELMAHAYSDLFEIPATGLRFFTVYGPWGRPDMAYFSFAKAIFEGRDLTLFAPDNMVRDHTYIDDVVLAIAALIDRPPEGNPHFDGTNPVSGSSKARWKIYNIGNHNPVSLNDFVSTLEDAIGKTANRIIKPMQSGDVPVTFADVSTLQRDLGFRPKTPLKLGIGRFVEWYRSYYGV